MSQMFHYPLKVEPTEVAQMIVISDQDDVVVADLHLDPENPEDLALAEYIRRVIEHRHRSDPMSYKRVIPRDLFNEASLLKMLGNLWIFTEGNPNVELIFVQRDDGSPFNIQQDQSDGSITVVNIICLIKGEPYYLYRPLNSREPWPLWISDHNDPDFDDFKVFDGDAQTAILSNKFKALIA